MTDFADIIDAHHADLRIRSRSRDRRVARMMRSARPAESVPPSGQAGLWYDDVAFQSPSSARDTARQLARLCGDDSEVVLSWRSLADAVHVHDRLGRPRAYVEGGAEWLRVGGWLRWSVEGSGRGARTTFQLLPGDDNWRGTSVAVATKRSPENGGCELWPDIEELQAG